MTMMQKFGPVLSTNASFESPEGLKAVKKNKNTRNSQQGHSSWMLLEVSMSFLLLCPAAARAHQATLCPGVDIIENLAAVGR